MKTLSVSQRIEHEKYGLGVISSADSDYTVIEFDQHGRKKFVTRLLSLQASEEPPPKRRRSTRAKKSAKTTKSAKSA